MLLSKLVGLRTKETPAGVMSKSHAYLLRAGFIKQVSNGIYSLLPPAKRVASKIENIIREEMDAIGGQEVMFPVVMPREMWDESGRYESIGDEMVRFQDRTKHDMLLGMTHEEAAVHLCRNTVKSYDQLPFMIYQIQTKFRDEARSRAGLIRAREFTMKDAYSFHDSSESLKAFYKQAYKAYENIFTRIGMQNVIAVRGDNGMMGGKVSHEFMLLTDVGEDSLVICDSCGYKSNMEVADGVIEDLQSRTSTMREIETGDAKEIKELCELLKIMPEQTCKAVTYAIKGDSKNTVLVFIRGDLEVNETKLQNLIKKEIAPADLKDSELVAGNIGPCGLNLKNTTVLFDVSLRNAKDVVCGANSEGLHLEGVCIDRDVKPSEYHDLFKVKDGMKCPECGGRLSIKRGIEVGNIFELETKYTKPMNMTVHGANGEEINPLMGCYGIGVGRSLASVQEEQADEKGLVWPVAIAPWHVYLCPLRLDDEQVKNATDKLYKDLTAKSIEVLCDDRNVSAGVKFADSELMGLPLRIVVSSRNLVNNEAEVIIRKTGEKVMVKFEDVVDYVDAFIHKA